MNGNSYLRAENSATPSATPVPTRRIDLAHGRVNDLGDLLDALEARLELVLTPEAPAVGPPGNIAPARPVQSPAADLVDRLESVARRIGRLIDRVEA